MRRRRNTANPATGGEKAQFASDIVFDQQKTPADLSAGAWIET
jgi:hypothetical protein